MTLTALTGLCFARQTSAQGTQQLLNFTCNYGAGNNGQITRITDSVEAGRTVDYTYDP